MIKRKFKLCAGFLIMLSCSLVKAYIPDLKSPIEVQSDSAEYDTRTGIAKHLGHVLMNQGDRELHSEELLVHRNQSGNIILCIAKGSPAFYRGALEADKPSLEGQAKEIRFDPVLGLLTLEGDAELLQENYLFKGPNIIYDLNEKKIKSGVNRPERTVIIIHPKNNE
jgi:lipopolysaccharide transport protein LptA